MKLAGRIPVEPLDEERLTNIERRVVAGAVDAAIRGQALGAPGRMFGRAAVAVAIAVAGVLGWALHAPAGGPVGGAAPELRAETSAERAVLEIGDATIQSEPGTAFAVTRPGDGVLIAMTRGVVELEVGKRGQRPPLVVRAGDTDVVVVGTHFTVDYGDGTGEVAVRVAEGVVRVVRQQHETRVAAGQVWQTRAGLVAIAGDARAAAPDTAPGTAPGAAGDARAAAPDTAPGTAPGAAGDAAGNLRAGAPPQVAAAPELLRDHRPAAPELLRDHRPAAPELLRDRKPAVPGAAASAPPPPPRIAAVPRPASGEPARARAQTRDAHGDLRAEIRAQHVEPALALGEPGADAAIARYYDIAAHQSGDEASQAFYSIAAVRHLRLGRNAEALQTLDAYVRRFPGGKEYRAALWLRVRILCLDKIDDRCRAAAYTYLHQAPDTPAAHVAELVTQTE